MTAAIIGKLGVNAAWLLHGQGEPFAQEGKRTPTRRGTPISDVLLCTVPQTSQSQLSAATLDMLSMLSPTQYWLRLGSMSPLLAQGSRGFLSSDMILIEADRSLFPSLEKLWERLCVVNLGTGKKPKCVLAEVCFYRASIEDGDERIEATPLKFDPNTETIEQIVLQRSSNGKVQMHQSTLTLRKSGRHTLIEDWKSHQFEKTPRITPAQIVGLWTGMIYRPT